MGNLGDCNCKCKDNKQEGEVNLPTTKTNLNDIQNQEISNNKNLNDLFKKNPIPIKDNENNEEYLNDISEIKLNDFDEQNRNIIKSKGETEKRTRENSIKKKKEELINALENYYNLNYSTQNKENINTNKKNENDNSLDNLSIKNVKSEINSIKKQKNLFEPFSKNNNNLSSINNKKMQSQKLNFFFNKNKTYVGKHTPVIFNNKINNNVELNKTNSTKENNISFISQLSQFNTENCKEFLEKYHLICSHLTIDIPINDIIKNINLLHKDSLNPVLFHSELNRVQFSGGRVISKKYIGRFFSSTKNEINIYASKEKFITLQNPLQTFLYKNMNKSCLVEFELGKKNNKHLTPTFNKKKDPFHFMIYFKNETFEILSSENEELIGKWVTLINYLIDVQNKKELNND